LLSGLSNCGYVGRESETFRARWRGRLNEHLLFTELTPAFEFRQLSDARVPEHAPFFVCGLYMIQEVETGA